MVGPKLGLTLGLGLGLDYAFGRVNAVRLE